MTSSILATGGGGQLATALARARPNQVAVVGRPAFDYDRPATIEAVLLAIRPALVINAAAWTAVDAAEASPEAADRANHTGPGRLAKACRGMDIPLIHLSTDYVFDGCKGAPYIETDPTSPTGTYGATKRAGEQAVLAAHPGAVILRTSWVYARAGKNFVLTILNASRTAPRLRVVADQIGCPTNADDLAAACVTVADQLLEEPRAALGGIYHASGRGETSWYGFAMAILEEAARHGRRQPPIEPIATTDWPTPARRPPDSRLDCTKLAAVFGISLPPWRPSLARTIATICGDAPDAIPAAE